VVQQPVEDRDGQGRSTPRRRSRPRRTHPDLRRSCSRILLRRRWSLPVVACGLAVGPRAVRRAFPPTPDRLQVAGVLASRGLGWAVRQESRLLLRHWRPGAVAGALVSRNVRRAIATAAVIDAAVGLAEHRHRAGRVNPIMFTLGRRLDDAAYGAGPWWVVVKTGSTNALIPQRPKRAARAAHVSPGTALAHGEPRA